MTLPIGIDVQEEYCPTCGAALGISGELAVMEDALRAEEEESRRLRARIGALSNGLEAAFNYLSEEQERGFDPDREVLCDLLYRLLNPDEKPEGDEGDTVFW